MSWLESKASGRALAGTGPAAGRGSALRAGSGTPDCARVEKLGPGNAPHALETTWQGTGLRPATERFTGAAASSKVRQHSGGTSIFRLRRRNQQEFSSANFGLLGRLPRAVSLGSRSSRCAGALPISRSSAC